MTQKELIKFLEEKVRRIEAEIELLKGSMQPVQVPYPYVIPRLNPWDPQQYPPPPRRQVTMTYNPSI